MANKYTIGIDASHAFFKKRTGVEEYAYQLVQHLGKVDHENEYILYVRETPPEEYTKTLPSNFKIKVLPFPVFWTQIRLSLHFLRKSNRPHIYFSPTHTLPIIHPKKSFVIIQGIEFIKTPESYSRWHNFYHRLTARYSLKSAHKVISASESTKKDLIEEYQADPSKITVISDGFTRTDLKNLTLSDLECNIPEPIKPYLFFVSRIEGRKNVVNIVKAFNILKEDYKIPHKLILTGSPGSVGYDEIKKEIESSPFQSDIIETGFISDTDKFILHKNADLLVFTTVYEGFGLPILEAMQYNVPSVTSDRSSVLELGGKAALYADHTQPQDIADKINSALNDEAVRNKLIENCPDQVKKFSWAKCARETLKFLTS